MCAPHLLPLALYAVLLSTPCLMNLQVGRTPLDLAEGDELKALLLSFAPPQPRPTAVPAPPSFEVAALLSRLNLTRYSSALVSELGFTDLSYAAHVTEDDLEKLGMKPVERRALLVEMKASHAPMPRPRGSIIALSIGISAFVGLLLKRRLDKKK